MSTQKLDPVNIACEGMEIFRVEMETIARISKKISAKTNRIIKVVLGLLTVISIYLVFLIVSMSQDLSAMIGSLDAMYVEFGSMSGEMRQITAHVTNMGQNVHGITSIGQNMQQMNVDVGDMLLSLENVSRDMQTIDANVGYVGTGTSEMAYRFHNVQGAVNVMQHDIGNMLRPMNMMPR